MLGTVDFTGPKVAYDTAGTHRRAIGKYTGPSSYPTGGDAVTGQDFKLFGVLELIDFGPAVIAAGTSFKTLAFNPATNKIQSFDANGNETANATDLSGYASWFEAIGE